METSLKKLLYEDDFADEPIEGTEEIAQPGLRIFCDMDGVLCDFEREFEKHSGHRPGARDFESVYGQEVFWKMIEKAGLEFWSQMVWTYDGKQLWSYLTTLDYPVEILSAPAKMNRPIAYKNSIEGKRIWVKENLGGDIKINLVSAREKQQFVTSKNSILIDDYKRNIDQWRASGGTGILHFNADSSIDNLEKIIYEYENPSEEDYL